ncbi:MAG TPA: hypothetical protein DCS28_03540 [Candidatus Moranbacteria bacterium]|nr:hypothetical protein [Candidatus Moranbacteria bacterium]HAT75085.1 hypothetical protein [Candidatus Moranbacteria bacterium]
MANGFTKKKVGTLTLGEKLKKLRSDKRIALNEVSRVTRIRVEYLECLEEGKYDELPADVYVRGFLKSYGDFMGVDERNLIRLYEKEKGINKNLKKSKNPAKEDSKIKPINISSFIFTPQKFALAFSIFVVLATFLYLYRQAGVLTNVPRLIIFNPETNSEAQGDSVLLEGKTDKDARVFVNEQSILTDDEGGFKENVALQDGINVIKIKAVNRFQKEAVENITVQAKLAQENIDADGSSASNEILAQNMPEVNEQTMQIELTIDSGSVWISVEADGNLIFSGTVLAGAVQNFSAYDKIVISSGRANVTHIKLNGKDMGVLGDSDGAVKGVVFENN